jgi:hypothetical protein
VPSAFTPGRDTWRCRGGVVAVGWGSSAVMFLQKSLSSIETSLFRFMKHTVVSTIAFSVVKTMSAYNKLTIDDRFKMDWSIFLFTPINQCRRGWDIKDIHGLSID